MCSELNGIVYPCSLYCENALSVFTCCKSSLCIPESILRMEREQSFICYREGFTAPDFGSCCSHTLRFL